MSNHKIPKLIREAETMRATGQEPDNGPIARIERILSEAKPGEQAILAAFANACLDLDSSGFVQAALEDTANMRGIRLPK